VCVKPLQTNPGAYAHRLVNKWTARLTLWLAELAFLNTSFQSLVKENIKHLVSGIDVVIGLDIFLEGNTTV
jgi:hypothetical protein